MPSWTCPASPWEVVDALDKVRLNEGEQLYMEIEDYDAFEYLSPHLDGLDISLNELNDLAALLSVLDEVQEVAFEGLFSIEVQRKVKRQRRRHHAAGSAESGGQRKNRLLSCGGCRG